MTNPRIDGAVDQVHGKIEQGLGKLTGDTKLKVDGVAREATGRAKAAYGRVIDGLDDLADKAPDELRQPAKKGLEFARNKPLLTTGIIAGAAFLLGALSRKR